MTEMATPREKKLKPLLTDEFLSVLIEAVKICGWSVDHIESSQFVGWCFDVAGKEYPTDEELEPYPIV